MTRTSRLLLIGLVGVSASGWPTERLAFHDEVRHYTCLRTAEYLEIDGHLSEAAWEAVEWTEEFVDIEGDIKPRPRLRTRVKMLWDDAHLYIGAVLEEPHAWATLTERDAVIYQDNDFEVFLDPDGDTRNYYELEINALGTVWDLFLDKPYREGGRPQTTWDIEGLKSAVTVQGTLNDPKDRDAGWTVELALPWESLIPHAPERRVPREGERWRVNFSRVQWHLEIVDGAYRKAMDSETGKPLREDNWVWSPQGAVNMHRPEMWGIVEFSERVAGEAEP